MFDFLRDLRKSDEEKRQEALSAYLDGALTPAETERFEQLLASDEALRAGLEDQRLIRASMQRLPRVRAPRNFTLDPALYGRPVDSSADRLYPILRAATAVVAILFVFVLVIDRLPVGDADQQENQPVAMSEDADAPAEALEVAPATEAMSVEESVVEVTRIVELEEEEFEMAAEAPAEEEMAEEAADEAEAFGPADASGGGAAAEEQPAVGEAPVADEGLPPAPEAESTADTLPQAKATLGESRQAEPPAGTPVAEGDIAMTVEVLLDQETAGRATRLAQPDADDGAAESDGPGETMPEVRTGIDLSRTQLLAIILGLSLLILAIATLLLRRRTR